MIETNTLTLGDAYKLIEQVESNSVDCIYTDIPYLYENGGGGNSRLSRRIIKNKNEIKNISDGIDYEILDNFVRVMKKINCFIWCSKLQILDILNYFNNIDNVVYEILVWCKTNPVPKTNNVWLPDVEYCLYFREKGVALNDGYEIKHKYYIDAINKKDKDKYKHPTIKPYEIVKNHLLHTTQPGGVILDPFSGSGTTLAVAKDIDRKYIGFEIEKEYYEISKNRLNGIDANGQMSIFTDFNDV